MTLTGRFWQIDPLAEKYDYNSTYAFQENKMGIGVELEGLEVGFGVHPSAFSGGSWSHPKKIPTKQAIKEMKTLGKGVVVSTAAGVSAAIPGPEDIILGGILATRFGGAIMKVFTKLFTKADNAKDASKGMKNAEQVAEGKKFEADEMQKAIDEGKDVTGRNRLVLENGKGNVKGNRTDTDQLIKNEDGTFTVVETKRTSSTKQSKGQNAAQDQVENGTGTFETRTNQPSQGLKRGDKIKVTEYKRINKYNG